VRRIAGIHANDWILAAPGRIFIGVRRITNAPEGFPLSLELLMQSGFVTRGGAVFDLIADVLALASFAPSRRPAYGLAVSARPPRVGFWERLDRWAWKQVQKEREAYLGRAQNLAELEARMRDLDSWRGRLY
jgi:hypothetical protein